MSFYCNLDAVYRGACHRTAQVRQAKAVHPSDECDVCNVYQGPSIIYTEDSLPRRVETVETLKQHYVLVPSHIREPYLFYLLCNPPESTHHLRRAPPEPIKRSRKLKPERKQKQKKAGPNDEEEPEQPPPTIIFCTKPRTAAFLTTLLKTLSIRSTALHSRLTQRERLTSLSLFRSSVIPVLISTDVGARGLDIEDVAIVINWDLPNEPEEYTHRVGRTARAGRGGVAISFVTERDEERILKIEERISEYQPPRPINHSMR